MRTNRENRRRILAGMLTAVCLLQTATPAAMAAAPAVETDEAVYVNLDYYGALSDMRVVKGVSLNGLKNFTDYGNYAQVINMTGYDKPTQSAGKITWNLKEADQQRFYYECIPTDAKKLALPWTFDVTYRLNGVQVSADQLAGASGTVQIDIQAKPNMAASAYYRNNMALIVMQGIDMSKNLSIDAPDAQVQSLGTYKSVIFTGLPGEECNFTTRIGSDSFEYAGTYMMMAPLTGSELDRVADLREAKDKLENASDELHLGMNAMLGTINGMKSGIGTMTVGLSGLDSTREKLSSSDAANDADMDQMLTDLQAVIDQMDASLPEMQDSITVLQSTNQTMDRILDDITASQSDIAAYQKCNEELNKSLDGLITMLDDLATQTYKNNDYEYVLNNAKTALSNMNSASSELASSINDLQSNLYQLAVTEKTILAKGGTVSDSMKTFLTVLSQVPTNLMSNTETMLKAVSNLGSSAQSTLALLDSYHDVIEKHDGDLATSLGAVQKLVTQANSTLKMLDSVENELPALKTSLGNGTKDITSMLDKSTSLITATKQSFTSTKKSLTGMRQTLLDVRGQASDSTKKSIDGMLDMMQKALDSTATGKLQDANDSIYHTTNNEFDKLDNETNVLDIDNSLALESFTSKKNPPPASLQFIVRTEEISIDTAEKQAVDEPAEADEGVLNRILKIFQKIGSAIGEVFAQA